MISIATVYNVFIRDFRRQKKRITLTLIALAWGTISIMLLLGFGQGMHHQMSVNRAGMGDSISILWGGQTSIPYKGLGKGRSVHLHKDDVEFLRKLIPEIRYIGGEYHRWGVELHYGDVVLSEHVNGIPPNYEYMRAHIPQMGGRMINELDIKLKRRVAFLGDDLKERLFGDEDAIGKRILVNKMPFVVIGVMQPKIQMSSYSGQDESKLSIPATTFETVFGDRYLDNLVYQPHDVSQMKTVERKVFEAMGSRYKFDPDDDRALSIWDVAESARQFNNIMTGINLFLGFIGGLTLLIAGVGVANIMYVSIKERTREIGIKMAVGARRSYILAPVPYRSPADYFCRRFSRHVESATFSPKVSNASRSNPKSWTSWDDRRFRSRSASSSSPSSASWACSAASSRPSGHHRSGRSNHCDMNKRSDTA